MSERTEMWQSDTDELSSKDGSAQKSGARLLNGATPWELPRGFYQWAQGDVHCVSPGSVLGGFCTRAVRFLCPGPESLSLAKSNPWCPAQFSSFGVLLEQLVLVSLQRAKLAVT